MRQSTVGLCGRRGLFCSLIASNLYLKLISLCAAWPRAKGTKPIWYTAGVSFRFLVMWIKMWKITIPLHFSLVSIFSFEAVMIRFFFRPTWWFVLRFPCVQNIIEKWCGTKGKKRKLTDVQKKDVSMAQPFAVFFMFLRFMIMLCGTPWRHESPLLSAIQFETRPLPSVHTDKTAWDGKSTWINIYYGRCCFRQVQFRGNLLRINLCYGNNLLIEVYLQGVLLWCSKQLHVGFTVKSCCIMYTYILSNHIIFPTYQVGWGGTVA